MREIEVKIKVDDLESVVTKLEALGCHLSAATEQRDVIFWPPTSDFLAPQAGNITMRIRYYPDRAVLTLKKQQTSEKDNLEYETDIKEPDEVRAMLAALGFQPIVEVKKVRRKGIFEDYEICLDDVEGLGKYVELESLAGDDQNPSEVVEKLYMVLATLGLDRTYAEDVSYPRQIYKLIKQR
jgi:adenylate cyclase, class 2